MNTLSLVSNASFLIYAMKIDLQLAENTKQKNCPSCGGKLHYARYQRKGRIGDLEMPADREGLLDWDTFHSLCCTREGCRKRVRPPSVRFAGQSPYSSATLLLAQLLTLGASQKSVLALCKILQVSERTVRRWLRGWEYIHAKSIWWRRQGSIFNLNGKSLHELWILLQTQKNLEESFKYIILNVAELWQEFKFYVGYPSPAKDA